MPLPSSGWRPEMQLDILQCTGQAPTAEKALVPNANSMKAAKPQL